MQGESVAMMTNLSAHPKLMPQI